MKLMLKAHPTLPLLTIQRVYEHIHCEVLGVLFRVSVPCYFTKLFCLDANRSVGSPFMLIPGVFLNAYTRILEYPEKVIYNNTFKL